jgi:hypothetical protein
MTLPGTPSDEVDGVLAVGRGEIGTLFVSMARRHPEGRDAEYLRWHTLDHRPEQHRLAGVRASLRLVSTPACRAARAHSDERFDAIDHVMTYFFTDQRGLTPFNELSWRWVGRTGSCRCCRRSSAVSTRFRRRRPHRGSRSAPTSCRGGPPAASICCWKPARHRDRTHRGRRCRRGLVGVLTAGHREAGQCAARSTAQLPVPRRRPGGGCAAAPTPAGDPLGTSRRPTLCWPHPSTRPRRTSGIAMCPRGFACGSA